MKKIIIIMSIVMYAAGLSLLVLGVIDTDVKSMIAGVLAALMGVFAPDAFDGIDRSRRSGLGSVDEFLQEFTKRHNGIIDMDALVAEVLEKSKTSEGFNEFYEEIRNAIALDKTTTYRRVLWRATEDGLKAGLPEFGASDEYYRDLEDFRQNGKPGLLFVRGILMINQTTKYKSKYTFEDKDA